MTFQGPLSTNGSDWGNFGSYVGGLLNGLLAPLTIYFVYQTFDGTKKQADLEIITRLYSDVVNEINNLQYRRLDTAADVQVVLFTGLDAIYRFDDKHHHSPNSVLNHVNSIIISFEHLLRMVSKVRYKYNDQKIIMLTKVYFLYYTKVSWPVGHSIYSQRKHLQLDSNPDYQVMIKNYIRLTKETQEFLFKNKQIGKPHTSWMVEVLNNNAHNS